MAQLFVDGQRFVVSKEFYEAVIPKMSDDKLVGSLIDLAALETARDLGKLTCTPQDWQEVIELAQKLAFEISWRPFAQSVGINLEVR